MEKSKKTVLGFRLFVIIALAVTGWALVEKTGVANSDEAGILLELPNTVGSWHGIEMRFCPNRDCNAQYVAETLKDPSTCPKCGSPLGNMNWAERSMLPDDTGLVRKYYSLTRNREGIHVTIVLSGDDRSSIHRPQVCMTAAGNEIADERTIRIPLADREELLEVRVMDMSKSVTRADGTPASSSSYYAYWFVGKGRETSSHLERMGWMAFDRIFHGVSHRWAYIAMSGTRVQGSDAHLQTIANFASQLHPALLKPE